MHTWSEVLHHQHKALTQSNILAAWKASGLWPLDPNRVLSTIQRAQPVPKPISISTAPDIQRTPATAEGFVELRRLIEGESHVLSESCRCRMEKAFNAAENALADRGLLLDENRLLFQQNCEKASRTLKPTVVGTARVISYDDIVLAQTQQNATTTNRRKPRNKSRSTHQNSLPSVGHSVSSRTTELEKARHEIEAFEFSSYCHILEV